jgi:hypothetical protein
MEFLVYRKGTGKLQSVNSVQGVYDADELIRRVYGAGGTAAYGAIEWSGDFPVGKIMQGEVLVADPNYVPPPAPTEAPEPVAS